MSDELERAAEIYANRILHTLAEADSMVRAFKAGAKWQAERDLERIKELESQLKILTNPSDGRCMEVGAFRARIGKLEDALQSIENECPDCKAAYVIAQRALTGGQDQSLEGNADGQ